MAQDIQDPKAVFKKVVNERLNLHPNIWAGEDSFETVKGVVTNVVDGKGDLIELTPEEENVMLLASRPTADVQVQAIRTIVENHGGKFDSNLEGLVRRVVSATAFKIELAKAGIIKEPKASGLKDLLG